jgi:hypothetical protein
MATGGAAAFIVLLLWDDDEPEEEKENSRKKVCRMYARSFIKQGQSTILTPTKKNAMKRNRIVYATAKEDQFLILHHLRNFN